MAADVYTDAAFTRVVPVNNRVVFFPSRYYHTVVRVAVPTGAFADGRFAINGHVRVT